MNLSKVIKACQSGDRKHQKALYDYTYERLIMAIALYTKDTTQRDWVFNLGMLKVFSSLDRFTSDTNYLGWARTILVRSAVDHHRKNKKYFDHLAPIVNEEVDLNLSEFNAALDKLENDLLVQIIQSLPDKERVVFSMFEVDGYKHEEIETMTGINRNTSKWLLSKARKSLKEKATKLFHLETLSHGK